MKRRSGQSAVPGDGSRGKENGRKLCYTAVSENKSACDRRQLVSENESACEKASPAAEKAGC